MLVSSVNRSGLIEFVTVEREAAEVPAFLHAFARPLARRLLLGRQHALAGLDRDQARHRLATARDHEGLALLHGLDVLREALVGIAKRQLSLHDLDLRLCRT